MRLETQFIRTFVLNCTKLRTSSNSHPCHPRDGDDCLSAIFFASFLSENLQNVQNVGIFAQKMKKNSRDLSKKTSIVSIKKLRDHLSFCPFVHFVLS